MKDEYGSQIWFKFRELDINIVDGRRKIHLSSPNILKLVIDALAKQKLIDEKNAKAAGNVADKPR